MIAEKGALKQQDRFMFVLNDDINRSRQARIIDKCTTLFSFMCVPLHFIQDLLSKDLIVK